MNGLRPIVGRQYVPRQFTPRTSIEAFGSPFTIKRRRKIEVDDVIGAACAVIVMGMLIRLALDFVEFHWMLTK